MKQLGWASLLLFLCFCLREGSFQEEGGARAARCVGTSRRAASPTETSDHANISSLWGRRPRTLSFLRMARPAACPRLLGGLVRRRAAGLSRWRRVRSDHCAWPSFLSVRSPLRHFTHLDFNACPVCVTLHRIIFISLLFMDAVCNLSPVKAQSTQIPQRLYPITLFYLISCFCFICPSFYSFWGFWDSAIRTGKSSGISAGMLNSRFTRKLRRNVFPEDDVQVGWTKTSQEMERTEEEEIVHRVHVLPRKTSMEAWRESLSSAQDWKHLCQIIFNYVRQEPH